MVYCEVVGVHLRDPVLCPTKCPLTTSMIDIICIMRRIHTALRCGIVIHLIFYKHSTIQTTLRCGIVIHLLFYKHSAIQTTLRCGIVIHLLFVIQILRNPNCFEMWNSNSFVILHILRNLTRCEMWDLLMDLVWSVLILHITNLKLLLHLLHDL